MEYPPAHNRETYSRLLQAFRSQNGPKECLQAYLFRTLHNLVVDHFRRQRQVEILGDKASSCEHIEENAEQNITKRCEQQQVIVAAVIAGVALSVGNRCLKFVFGYRQNFGSMSVIPEVRFRMYQLKTDHIKPTSFVHPKALAALSETGIQHEDRSKLVA